MAGILVRAAAAAFVGLAVAPAAGQHTITKTEVRTAPPLKTHQRLRDVVWDMFQVQDFRRKKRPVNALSDVWLDTNLRGTGARGLCRYDSVRVELAPDDPDARGPDTPVHAIGLAMSHHFAFLKPPAKAYSEAALSPARASDTDCLSLKGQYGRFFQAESEELAYNGYREWLTLRSALAGRQPAPLECELFPDDKRRCEDVVLKLDADDVGSIEACEATSGESCYRLWIDEFRLTLVVSDSASGAAAIRKAKLEAMIVMRHERID